LNVQFDATVTLGNIVTIASFLVYAAVNWKAVTMKLKQHDEYIAEHKKCHQTQIQIVAELREALAFMKGRISAGAAPFVDKRSKGQN
jgi:hypothetical protein